MIASDYESALCDEFAYRETRFPCFHVCFPHVVSSPVSSPGFFCHFHPFFSYLRDASACSCTGSVRLPSLRVPPDHSVVIVQHEFNKLCYVHGPSFRLGWVSRNLPSRLLGIVT